jgi:hypothetical protein
MKKLIKKILREEFDWIRDVDDPWADIPKEDLDKLSGDDLSLITRGLDWHIDTEKEWSNCYKNKIKIVNVYKLSDERDFDAWYFQWVPDLEERQRDYERWKNHILVDYINTCVDSKSDQYNRQSFLRLYIDKVKETFEIDAL